MSENKMLKLGALWVSESKTDGQRYLSGYLGDLKLLIFPNKYKTEDSHPTYIMYVVEKERKTSDADIDFLS